MKKFNIDGFDVLVDDEDAHLFEKYSFKIHKNRGEPAYIQTTLMLHRLIMDCPKGYVVDHVNHNGFDNRKENLKIVSHANNMKNKVSSWVRRAILRAHLSGASSELESVKQLPLEITADSQ